VEAVGDHWGAMVRLTGPLGAQDHGVDRALLQLLLADKSSSI
jgi:hypothetical protein